MTTQTTRLGLNRHTTADVFRIADYTENWNRIDAAPGVHIGASTARPAWGIAQSGRLMFEDDTRLLWYWSGSAFVRVTGRGLISDPDAGQRVTDWSTNATTYQTGIAATAAVASGDRPHLVVVEGPGVRNNNGVTELAIQRDNTILQEWRQYGGTGTTAAEQPRPVFALALDTPTQGTYNYYLMFRASTEFGGTSTLDADINAPLGIRVIEL